MKFTHPDSQQVIDVREADAGPYLAEGWEPKSGKAADK